MSFLDDVKIYGIIAMVVGILALLLGLFGAIDSDNAATGSAAAAIPGLMLIFVGFLAYAGKTDTKLSALTYFLLFVGIGIFIAACLGVYGENFYLMVGVIAGIIAAVIGFMLLRGNKLNEIWWIVLLLVFILFAVFKLLEAIDWFDIGGIKGVAGAIGALLYLVLFLYMIYFLMSKEVKNKFV
ncbi:MAG: hypothetical protein FWD37_06605 [Methanomassiliicoccaceae archaeon]|nr:hypothetical protein [Methanomassiliicoccaceae archaeon]